MGGKGGDRKSYKATSSAKAAEALAAKGGTAGFGGFAGVHPVAGFGFGAPAAAAAAVSGTANADNLELSAQLDGDLAQCLRHMSKKDTTTKMKALQNLRDLIPQKTTADLTLLLQPWVYQFKRLLLDPSKAVRSESAAIMAAVASGVGKALLPQLKSVLGPWYLASFDPYTDAAAAAKRSLAEVFPDKKQADALIYCRSEVLAHIITSLNSTPATLGDPRKDTPEEMEERHERVVAASLTAAAALLITLQQQQQQQGDAADQAGSAAAAAAAVQEVSDKLQEILQSPGFVKKHLGSKSVLIRRASYGFVKTLSSAAADLLQECQAAAAAAVLGALQEKEPSNHPVMWEMLLSYITSQQPSCWEHINMQKAFLPRLLAFLRHGCYGSAASSLPALLPLLVLLPRQLLTWQPDKPLLLDQILEAVWSGGVQYSTAGSAARVAAAAAYQECMNWGLINAPALSSDSAAAVVAAREQQQQQQQGQKGRQFCLQLLQQGHYSSLLDVALSSSGLEGEAAAALVRDLLLLQVNSNSSSSSDADSTLAEPSVPVQLDVMLDAISVAAQKHLTQAVATHQQQQQAAGAESAVECARLQQLVDSLSDSSGPHSQAAAARLAASCCSALLPLLQAGQQLPAAASQLVAKLLREYPAAAAAAAVNGADSSLPAGDAAAGGSSSSIAALVRMGITTCSSAGRLPAAADLDLLLSCLGGSSDTAAAWGQVFSIAAAADEEEASPVAVWRFVNALLQSFVESQGSSSTSVAVAAAVVDTARWSHPGLDHLLLQLMRQLSAAAAGVVVSNGTLSELLDSSVVAAAGQQQQLGLNKSQAAAAALLGCCLGANEQQQVLLSHDALHSVLQDIRKCLAAVLEAIQQQQNDELAAALAAAANVCIAAVHMALESSSRAVDSSGSSIWQQQPQQLVEVLLLLAQLSWGGQPELLLTQLGVAAADGYGSSSEDEDVSSEDSSSSAANSHGSAMDAHLQQQIANDVSNQQEAGLGSSSSSSSALAPYLAAVQQAASRVWNPELLESALSELPETTAQQLLRQLQQLLVQGLSTAAAAGSMAAELGLRWGRRAAVVLSGLHSQQQQQELVQQLLAAVPGWQRWSGTSSSSADTNALGEHTTMIRFAAVLALEVGCDVLFPFSSQYNANHPRPELASLESSRQWLLLDLICTAIELQTAAAAGAGDCSSKDSVGGQQMQECISAAAAAATRHLLRTAGKISSTAAAAAARSVLSSTLSSLLSSAASAADIPSAAAAAKVYSQTLAQLLRQSVMLVNARLTMQQQLLPLLEAFMSKQVTAAASRYVQTSTDAAGSSSSSSSSITCPAWVLVLVIEVLAGAFRFSCEDDSSVTSSGLSQLSVGFINKALAVDPQAGSSSSSSDGQFEQLLQLAVACFPRRVEDNNQHGHHHSAAATAAAGGQDLHSAAGSSTALERQALTALLRHACSSSSNGGLAAAAAAAAPVAELLCKLQLCCVSYCWSDMSAAEWRVVLRDSQQRLTNARREIERAAGSLAAAACTAAEQLMSAAAAASLEVMTPSMAIEVLRRLARKGLLQRQAAVTQQLTLAADQAVSGLSKVFLPSLRLALQLLAAVMQLQQQIQAAGRAPQLDLALQSAWRELLAMLMALGAAAAVAAACGPSVAAVLQQCIEAEGSTWQLLGSCLSGSDTDMLGRVLAAADERTEMLGVDAVSGCLALLQAPWGYSQQQQQQHGACEPLQQLAWKLLLHANSIASITHAAAPSSSSSSSEDVPEYGGNDDAATYLVQVGLRPEMASAITASNSWQVHLLHWTLLLVHIDQLNAKRSSAAAVKASRKLTQALRDVPELVPDLLERLVSLMGLGSGSSSGRVAAAAAVDSSGDTDAAAPVASAALSAAAQAQLSAKLAALCPAGQVWNLSMALRTIGLPIGHSSWRLLSAAVYRAVLCLLPASARIWFSDLRDRSRIAAVETYTTRYESPAILAAEFAAIKRDAAGSSGEVGGSCSFRVTASPSSREVTAVLEIEDGATLELQVKLPAAAPLKAAEVECRNKVGIKDGRLRKWLLSIAVFLRNQNQGVIDAISMWKVNLEQEFAGVQPCLICYSVISAANGQLPRLSCKQCSVTFHPACLYKWFRSSGKSTCPHCQAPW